MPVIKGVFAYDVFSTQVLEIWLPLLTPRECHESVVP
jgi:hypothetical protein